MEKKLITHFAENFGLFGFGNVDSAILQSCKELIENSLAACTYSDCPAPRISLSLKQDTNCVDTITIEIIDNGCGIADLESIVAFFSSRHGSAEVDSDYLQIKGKYGIGLTTTLLYSQLHTHAPIRIITKTPSQHCCSLVDILFCMESAQHRISRRVVPSDMAADAGGTRIRVVMPFPHDIHSVVAGVDMYFSRLNFLPTSFVEASLQVHTSYPSLEKTCVYECCTRSFAARCTLPDPLTVSAEDTALSRPVKKTVMALSVRHRLQLGRPYKEDDNVAQENYGGLKLTGGDDKGYADMQVEEVADYARSTPQFRNEGSVSSSTWLKQREGVRAFVNSYSARIQGGELTGCEVTTSIIVQLEGAADNGCRSSVYMYDADNAGVGDGGGNRGGGVGGDGDGGRRGYGPSQRSIAAPKGYPLELWRYVNGSPLLDQADDALTCVMSAALRSVQWTKKYGLRLKLVHLEMGGEDDSCGCDGGSAGGLVRVTKWMLVPVVPIQDPEESGDETSNFAVKSVTAIVNIQSDSVPYANMAKTAVSQQEKYLITACKTAIGAAMDCTHAELAELGCRIFASKGDRMMEQMCNRHIKTVARAIAKIIHFSPSSSFQQDCLSRLGMSVYRLDEDEISAALTARVADIIDRKCATYA